ncbi:MAG: type II toxin-antitoxin system VapC family toxin [Methylocystis sp.]
MSYLLDTNVLSEFQKPRPDEGALDRLRRLEEDELYISVVSIGEIRRGVALLAPGRRKSTLEHWLSFELLPRFEERTLDVTPHIAQAWGETMAEAKRLGVAISTLDAYLAATAQVHSLTLVTRNTKDFKAFNQKLLDPWQPAR